jgi:hypothetical protein
MPKMTELGHACTIGEPVSLDKEWWRVQIFSEFVTVFVKVHWRGRLQLPRKKNKLAYESWRHNSTHTYATFDTASVNLIWNNMLQFWQLRGICTLMCVTLTVCKEATVTLGNIWPSIKACLSFSPPFRCICIFFFAICFWKHWGMQCCTLVRFLCPSQRTWYCGGGRGSVDCMAGSLKRPEWIWYEDVARNFWVKSECWLLYTVQFLLNFPPYETEAIGVGEKKKENQHNALYCVTALNSKCTYLCNY